MIVMICTYTRLIKINPLRFRLRQMSPVVNWPRETSSLVTDKRRDEKRQTGGNPCGMKVKSVYLRKCFMVSAFLLAGPENSRIINVINVGRGRLKRAAQAAATAATGRHQAPAGGPGAPELPALVHGASPDRELALPGAGSVCSPGSRPTQSDLYVTLCRHEPDQCADYYPIVSGVIKRCREKRRT